MDGKELEAWLKTRPREDAVLIALRAALRVWPFAASCVGQDWAKIGGLSALPILRSLLICGVSRKFPTVALAEVALAAAAATEFANGDSLVSATNTSVDAANAYRGACSASSAAAYAARAFVGPAIPAGISTWAAVSSIVSRSAPEIWSALEQDVEAMRQRSEPGEVSLWKTAPSQAIKALESQALEALAAETGDPNSFWHRWYLGARDGQWLDWDFQREVALIPDEVWRQGHKAVSQAIAEIEARYRKSEAQTQAELLLHAAIADFSFDAINRVMRMVPFADEIRHLRDPARLSSFLDDADAIRDDLELFSHALAAEGAMQGAGFVRTYLNAVLDEFARARQMEHLRVGRVIELGKILEEYATNEEVAAEFGPAIHALRSHVQSLLALTRRHFAATLTRMAPLQDISTSPDDDQWTLLQDIQRGINALAKQSAGGPAPLAVEDKAVLFSISESVERLLRQNEVIGAPQSRSSLQREVDFRLALLVVSVGLCVEKGQVAIGESGKVLDSIATQYKRASGVVGLWKLIKAAFLGGGS